jgi:hypothetical protein
MTSRQANSFVKEWQARLGLQNWEVSITVVEPEVLGDNEAETLWDPREALAEIKIKRNVQGLQTHHHPRTHPSSNPRSYRPSR